MNIYQVGGAVRDRVLKREVTDCDWVVVGETVEGMLAKGFKPVGKDFPVFLHPDTKEEYALARTERKVAKGYHGFEFYASPDVTLVDDLARRDLTINAMAQSMDSDELIDPYGGQHDCQQKILRHVSSAFVEDPVRVLRLARFAAMLPDFTIADETKDLVTAMQEAGELSALVSERVWQECEKAMKWPHALRFFQVLNELGVLFVVMPALNTIKKEQWQLAIDYSTQLHQPLQRFALLGLFLDLDSLHLLQEQLTLPKDFQVLLCWMIKHADKVQSLQSMEAAKILDLFSRLDLWRRPKRLIIWLQTVLVVNRLIDELPQWQALIKQCQSLDIGLLLTPELSDQEKIKAIKDARLQCIEHFIDRL